MDWKVLAALGFLGLALLGGFVIVIVTSVNSYAKRLAEKPPDKRRGFEVTPPRSEKADGKGSDQHH